MPRVPEQRVARLLPTDLAGGLTAGDLAGYPAEDGPARLMTLGAYSVALPGPRTGAGAFAAGLMNNLSRAGAGQ